MFAELYSAIIRYQKMPLLIDNHRWILDVDIHTGLFMPNSWISSLSAFWPGMQVLAGQLADAIHLHANYTDVWKNFGALPEMFSMDGKRRHDLMKGYPLRPEHIESTFYLYSETKDLYYLQVTFQSKEVFIV